MLVRMQGGVDGADPRGGRPPQVMRAIENLKLAMRMRLSREALEKTKSNPMINGHQDWLDGMVGAARARCA